MISSLCIKLHKDIFCVSKNIETSYYSTTHRNSVIKAGRNSSLSHLHVSDKYATQEIQSRNY